MFWVNSKMWQLMARGVYKKMYYINVLPKKKEKKVRIEAN